MNLLFWFGSSFKLLLWVIILQPGWQIGTLSPKHKVFFPHGLEQFNLHNSKNTSIKMLRRNIPLIFWSSQCVLCRHWRTGWAPPFWLPWSQINQMHTGNNAVFLFPEINPAEEPLKKRGFWPAISTLLFSFIPLKDGNNSFWAISHGDSK